MSSKPNALFVEKRTYRRRRMADAARLLPVFGVAFLSIPLLWSRTGEGNTSTTSAMLYIFGIWALLAAVSAAISRHLRPEESDDDVKDEGQ